MKGVTAPASPQVLLVTGSRSLASSPEMAAWAKRILHEEICDLPPGSVLLHGNAQGPDIWSHAIFVATSRLGLIEIYDKDGTFVQTRCTQGKHTVTRGRWGAGNPGPIVRNFHMVSVGLGYHAALREPRAVALVNPQSETRGTLRTLGHLEARKFPVKVHTWGS